MKFNSKTTAHRSSLCVCLWVFAGFAEKRKPIHRTGLGFRSCFFLLLVFSASPVQNQVTTIYSASLDVDVGLCVCVMVPEKDQHAGSQVALKGFAKIIAQYKGVVGVGKVA